MIIKVENFIGEDSTFDDNIFKLKEPTILSQNIERYKG